MNLERWASYPAATVYEAATGKKAIDQILWGRRVHVVGAAKNGRVPVSLWKALPEASPNTVPKKKTKGAPYGWIAKAEIQDKPVLEVVFVDIGQGDAALVVMPDGKRLLVDAGAGNNMRRFLEWRFGRFTKPQKFEAAVISHSDLDHYGGFQDIFATPGFEVATLYHNGLVERKSASAANALGKRARSGTSSFVTGLVTNDKEMRAVLSSDKRVKGKKYPTMLRNAMKAGKVKSFQALSSPAFEGGRRFLKGYGPDDPVRIEILGPVVEPVGKAKGLRWLGSTGVTKNGHSVILKLTIGGVRILLGGDLNTPSQTLLMPMHTKLPFPPHDGQAREALITKARAIFECDIAKACHHGSADFSEIFLAGLNPIATIVSSGDEESYAHPRPDAIGTYGLCGRGDRPMIFSTELARSAAEQFRLPDKYRKDLSAIIQKYTKAVVEGDPAKIKEAQKAMDAKLLDQHRAVSVYGAINVRTDGTKAVIAYMIERPRNKGKKWDLYRLEPGKDGRLRYVQKARKGG